MKLKASIDLGSYNIRLKSLDVLRLILGFQHMTPDDPTHPGLITTYSGK